LEERDILSTFLAEELRLANRHAPRRRLSLCELLEMEVPHVLTSDGSVHMIEPRELRLLHELVGRNCDLRLPIILEYIPRGEGLYMVNDPLEARVVAKILGLPDHGAPLVLYRSQVMHLRRLLRTCTTILISPRALAEDEQ